MRIKFGQNLIDKIKGIKSFYKGHVSYSQSGEDMIVNFILFSIFKKHKIKYLDIGAHHSTWLSNTKLFYNKGCRGVLIEPDPYLFKEIEKHRKNDICLNCGVGFQDEKCADFYIMDTKTLNTFDKKEAYYNQEHNNFKIKEIVEIPLIKINDIFEKYFQEGCDFCSLDVEGLEMVILESVDFLKHRPLVFCVETLEYELNPSKSRKNEGIINLLKQNDYIVYADTRINTIFVDKQKWDNICSEKM